MSSFSSGSQPALPRIPGPKLAPFTPTAHAQIEFIYELGRPDDQDARVWKVKIAGTQYALKIFEFKTCDELRSRPARYLTRPLARDQFYSDYFDPFNCECRVYGRLKAERREDLAVKAHGYLLLSPKQEAEVTKMIAGRNYEPDDPNAKLDGDNIWGRFEEHRGKRIRAIVKDLITDDDGEDDVESFNVTQIPLIWADLKGLHSLGILVRDIHSGNYLRGKLVDFGMAWTMYNPCLAHIGVSDIKHFRRTESHQLEIMFADTYPYADYDVPQDLQDASSYESSGVDARSFDWMAKDGQVAVRHVMKELYADTQAGGLVDKRRI